MKSFSYRYRSISLNISTLLLLLLLAVSSSLNGGGVERHLSIREFEKSIDRIYREIGQKKYFNAKNCDRYIGSICRFIYSDGESRYLPLTQRDRRRLLERADIILKKMFLLRIRLREKLKYFYRQKNLSKSCLGRIRMAFRYSRFTEEYLTELLVELKGRAGSANRLDFSHDEYQLYINPDYGRLQFKSGDILMIRSSSYISAVIARMGDEDGQFSHAAMIYVDREGEVYVMESLIEEGTVISPFDEWRKKNHHARAVLFRYHDEREGRSVAERLHRYIELRLKSGEGIPYDFHMNDKNSSEIYCAELIEFAFRHAQVETIPAFKSSYRKLAGHPFLDELTIHSYEGFAPSDLEVEPHLDLVAEWRNYDETDAARMEDAIQTKVLYWMSDMDYRLKRTPESFLLANIGLFARKALGIGKDLIPTNMPEGFFENIIKLYDLNRILERYLSRHNSEYEKKHGYPMDYRTMMSVLEKLRADDCRRYRSEQGYLRKSLTELGDSQAPPSLFHSLFNVENGLECPL